MNSTEIESECVNPVYKTEMVFLDYFCVHCFEIKNSLRLTVLRPLTVLLKSVLFNSVDFRFKIQPSTTLV